MASRNRQQYTNKRDGGCRPFYIRFSFHCQNHQRDVAHNFFDRSAARRIRHGLAEAKTLVVPRQQRRSRESYRPGYTKRYYIENNRFITFPYSGGNDRDGALFGGYPVRKDNRDKAFFIFIFKTLDNLLMVIVHPYKPIKGVLLAPKPWRSYVFLLQ